jgi:hypothetical protein
VRRDHYLSGRNRPDGSGHLTLHHRVWAYCAADKPTEAHLWQQTGAISVTDLRHEIDWPNSGAAGTPGGT